MGLTESEEEYQICTDDNHVLDSFHCMNTTENGCP